MGASQIKGVVRALPVTRLPTIRPIRPNFIGLGSLIRFGWGCSLGSVYAIQLELDVQRPSLRATLALSTLYLQSTVRPTDSNLSALRCECLPNGTCHSK